MKPEKVKEQRKESYVVKVLKWKQAVKFGNFLLASGQKSDVYIDIKSALVDPAALRMIANAMVYRAHWDEIEYGAVAGVAVGGVPLAVAASMMAMKPYIIIRKDEKGHGLSGRLIGIVPPKEQAVLLVEDVTTTGGSVCEAVRVLRNAGATVNTVMTVVDRDQGARSALAELGVKLVSLVTMKDLVG